MAEQTTIQGFAPQIAPMAEEAFTEAQNIYQQRVGEGYQQPETPLFTPFTQPELQAQQQTLDIAAGPLGRPAIQEAMAMTRQGAGGVGSLIPGLMSPYTEQVAQRAKERFAEDYDRQVINRLMSEATAAGSLRGARTGIERGLAQERKMRGLSEIDAQLLDKAYSQAAALATDQLKRQMTAAPQFARLGLAELGQELLAPELQAGVGQAQRGQLDLERRQQLGQELAAQQFPETTLQQYLNFLGLGRAPMTETKIRPDAVAAQQGPQRTSTFDRIGEIATVIGKAPEIIETGQNIFKAGKSAFDTISSWFAAEGGYVGGGLASLPAVRMAGGSANPTMSIFDPRATEQLTAEAVTRLQKAIDAPVQDYKNQPYTPGQRAEIFQTFRDYEPRRRETTLGQLLEFADDLGQTSLLVKEQQRKQALAKKAADIQTERDILSTALDLEGKSKDRQTLVMDGAKSLVESAGQSMEALNEALKETPLADLQASGFVDNVLYRVSAGEAAVAEAAKRIDPTFAAGLSNQLNQARSRLDELARGLITTAQPQTQESADKLKISNDPKKVLEEARKKSGKS